MKIWRVSFLDIMKMVLTILKAFFSSSSSRRLASMSAKNCYTTLAFSKTRSTQLILLFQKYLFRNIIDQFLGRAGQLVARCDLQLDLLVDHCAVVLVSETYRQHLSPFLQFHCNYQVLFIDSHVPSRYTCEIISRPMQMVFSFSR
jgi:hypothetical protein